MVGAENVKIEEFINEKIKDINNRYLTGTYSDLRGEKLYG
jgi:hypothetical protein